MTELSCQEIEELAALYVLGALEPAERTAVRDHLAGCSAAHAEVAELGAAVPALARSVTPAGAPAALKRRVLDAYRESQPVPLRAAAARPAWLGWSVAAAALLVIAVLGGWAMTLRAETDQMNERVAQLQAAISMMHEEGSNVAMLHGMGSHTGAGGFATFSASDGGYVVVVGLEPAPAGLTYQAWYMGDGHAQSAGLVEVGHDGYALLADAQPMPGMEMIELTMEPGGGSAAPTGQPVVMGAVEAHG